MALTPVALWTGRLPGLRPLPRGRTLWLAAATVALGAAGASGAFGPDGAWLGLAGSLVAGWTLLRHRWPTEIPLRLRSFEAPQGPDERAVLVTFRHDGMLLGWDAGILWFERGGVGFVGRTVSFVLPRATMARETTPSFEAIVRVPRLVAKVGETTVGFVPLARGLAAQMTLARLDALPADVETSETILPPTMLHPDLLQRGLAVRRRMPALLTIFFVGTISLWVSPDFGGPIPSHFYSRVRAVIMLVLLVMMLLGSAPMPSSIRKLLPREPRRRWLSF